MSKKDQYIVFRLISSMNSDTLLGIPGFKCVYNKYIFY